MDFLAHESFHANDTNSISEIAITTSETSHKTK